MTTKMSHATGFIPVVPAFLPYRRTTFSSTLMLNRDGRGRPSYQLALCLMENQQPDEAIVALQKIIKKDRRWSDYQAWHTLMKIQESQGKAIESLNTCRELEKMSPHGISNVNWRTTLSRGRPLVETLPPRLSTAWAKTSAN